MTIAVFLLALGSALRLTRLGTEDSITAPFRAWLAAQAAAERRTDLSWTADAPHAPRPARRARPFMALVQLFECPWCLGFWAAVATTTAAALATDGGRTDGWFLYPAIALSISYLIGAISSIVFTIEEI